MARQIHLFQVSKGRRAVSLPALSQRIAPVTNFHQSFPRETPRFIECQFAKATQGHAAHAPMYPFLENERLRSGRQPHTEAGQRVISQKDLSTRGMICRIDETFGKFHPTASCVDKM